MAPERLSGYPAVIVNVSCKLCPRRGRYKLARLAARFGPDALLDDVLAELAGDCRYWHPKPRRYDPRCGARFDDLDRLPPQDVAADGPLHRQRQPAREDIPQPRRVAADEAPTRMPMLSDWTAPRIAVVCEACRRRDVYETTTIRNATVGDVALDDLRRSLAGRCARIKTDACGARLEAAD